MHLLFRKSLVFICFLSIAMAGSSQSTNSATGIAADTLKPADSIRVISSTLMLEAGGNALYQSLNFEKMLITNGAYKLAFRAGIGFYLYDNILFPFELNYYRGKVHHWEIGLGHTPCTSDLNQFKGSVRQTQAMTTLRLGYRYISKDQRLMLRVGLMALWRSVFNTYEANGEVVQSRTFFYEKRNYYSEATIWDGIGENIIPWLGVSAGYNFVQWKRK